jgi:hypothetical protein
VYSVLSLGWHWENPSLLTSATLVRPHPSSHPGGRIAHFYSTTSPLTLLYSNESLREAQRTVRRYEELIKQSGKGGCWVGPKEKKEWEHAKQREWGGTWQIDLGGHALAR